MDSIDNLAYLTHYLFIFASHISCLLLLALKKRKVSLLIKLCEYSVSWRLLSFLFHFLEANISFHIRICINYRLNFTMRNIQILNCFIINQYQSNDCLVHFLYHCHWHLYFCLIGCKIGYCLSTNARELWLKFYLF